MTTNKKIEKREKLIVLLGQTATGKSDLAINLAKKFNGEVVSADSRQIYKKMNIGTAKPFQNKIYTKESSEGKQTSRTADKSQNSIVVYGINHHLIDVIYPNEEFNAAIYKKIAIKKIKEIQKRNKLPFLVGGTGLYISAIVDNINFPSIPPNPNLRKRLNRKSTDELLLIFKKLDPKGAKLIESKNKRRLIRAIEICKKTGKPFWQQRKKGKPFFDILQIGIKLPKEKLDKKIEKRADQMLKLGLEKEVRDLVKKYGFKIPPMKTIGYKEWQEHFERKIDKKKVKELIILHTKQFARRQMTWFKRDNKINWIEKQKEAEELITSFLL